MEVSPSARPANPGLVHSAALRTLALYVHRVGQVRQVERVLHLGLLQVGPKPLGSSIWAISIRGLVQA